MVSKLKRPKLTKRELDAKRKHEILEYDAMTDSARKKSRATSCARCKRRKQKCDHRLPSCTNCLKAGVPCVQPEKYFSQVPQNDPYITLLESKVAALEAQVQNPVDTKYKTSGNVSPDVMSNASGSASINLGQVKSLLENAPQSLNVVSSLLDEQYRFSINKNTDDGVSIEGSIGLLPDYNFEAFLKYKPIFVTDRALGARLFADILGGNAGRLPAVDRELLKEIQEKSFSEPENPDDPEYNYHQFLLYVIYALSKTTEYNNEDFQDFPVKKCKKDGEKHHCSRGGRFTESYCRGEKPNNGHSNTNNGEIQTTETKPDDSKLKEENKQKDCNGANHRKRNIPFTRHFNLYSTALRYARQCKATEDNKIWQIKALLLCSLFQLHTDLDDGYHIDMLRRAARMCIECKIHLEEEVSKETLYGQEMIKRLFWSVYNLERLAAVSIGREFVLVDKDITLTFPADIEDKDLRNDEAILAARRGEIIKRENGELGTSLSFLMCMWQMRQIESQIFYDMYFTKRSIEERYQLVHTYYDTLKSWGESMKPGLNEKQATVVNISYSKAIRALIQPVLCILSPESEYFKVCVQESGRICEIFRDFYRVHPQVFTTLGMNNAFIAGLTLIYCLWLAKDDNTQLLGILDYLRSCSSLLYVLAERTHLAVNYREKFESLLTSTMNHIKTSKENSVEPPFIQAQRKFLEKAGQLVTPDTAQSSPPVDTNTPPTTSDNFVMKLRNKEESSIPSNMPNSSPFVSMNDLDGNGQRTGIPISSPASPDTAAPGYWNNYYGYDDSVFNMIQDISSWSRTSDLTFDGTPGVPGAWMNSLTDFGYS